MRKLLFALIACASMAFSVNAFSQPVLYYWNFNGGTDTVTHTTGYAPDYVGPGGSTTGANFTFYPTTGCSWPTTAGCIDYTVGSGSNLQAGTTDPGSCLRLRTPADSMTFFMPTSGGFRNPKFSYAVQKSGSGPTADWIYYTTDGTNFQSAAAAGHGNLASYPVDSTTGWEVYAVDFSGDPLTFNNANFAVRISYGPAWGAGGGAGNNRFDNITLQAGTTAEAGSITAKDYSVFPNPVYDELQISAPTEGKKNIIINNLVGQKVYEATAQGSLFKVNTASLKAGIYYVSIHEATGEVTSVKFVKQ